MMASRGFVISACNPDVRSSEQDILVIDTSQEAPVFNQANLAVSFPQCVRAAISVKTTMKASSIADTISGLSTVHAVAAGDVCDPRTIWTGGHFFELADEVARNPGLVYGYAEEAMRSLPHHDSLLGRGTHPAPNVPDLLCSSSRLAYKFTHDYNSGEGIVVSGKMLGYECHDLATSLFVAELLDHLATGRGASGSNLSHFADHAAFDALGDPYTLLSRPSTK
jgi:hypothetical protein